MMTAKEYVEGKVKSYTRLAERCRREAEASDDIVVRAEYSARANVWEMCQAAGLQKRKQLCICEQPQSQRQASGSQVHF